jgi:hypothetical protein
MILKVVALHLRTMTQDESLQVAQRSDPAIFHRDQRLKEKASRERLERAGTEAPIRNKLADLEDTDDEPGIEDWG